MIFCGVQAAGETTLHRERCFDANVRPSMDMLRTRRRERLQPPSPEEGFDALRRVGLVEPQGFTVVPWPSDGPA